MGTFNGIYHIVTWNRHFIINNSKYLHVFASVGKNSHAINQQIKKTPCHISLRITQFGVILFQILNFDKLYDYFQFYI